MMSYFLYDIGCSMTDLLLPEQVKAARALLAWSQQELAAKARIATSTLADFERGVRTPTANNAQAVREALEAEGLKFVAGGVVEKSRLVPNPSARAGGIMRWVNATDLSQWAERRDGQSSMPELLRRLIYATVGPSAEILFPSDESVQQGGWDGICKANSGVSYVPSGNSCWEIGAQRTSIRTKAETDFKKRTKDPLGLDPTQTAFVFVTPQRFSGKTSWLTEKKALGIWRDVIVIDSDDLTHWLEVCPAVAQWLSVKIGRRPAGLRNLEEVWSEWIGATQVPLTEDVLLTGRDDDQIAVLKWLREPAKLLSMQADAPDEARSFLFAAISSLPENYRLSHYSRCVVVDNDDTARELVGLGTQLIVVLTDPEPGLAQRLVDDGHHVFAAYGPGVSNQIGLRILRRPWKFDLQMALVRAGISEELARHYSRASGRSITVLRRLMPAVPHRRLAWAESAPAELIAAMFAGAWVGTSVQDQQVISDLAGCPYAQVEEVLAPLTAIGGPLIRSGELWKIVSLRDLWTQIGGQVTPSQFARFETTFNAVLTAVDPRFSREQKSMYYEGENEFEAQPSPAIRSGLTETMIVMAIYPERATLISNIGMSVDRAIRKIFDNADASIWWSLSRDFENLAEAAPREFLDAIEASLEGDNPPINSLFRSEERMFQRTEYLSGLLWALEILARSPTHLPKCALLLARLHEIDPGGKWSNRPFASLKRIFTIWSPQTYAKPAERLKVIDTVILTHPNVGWTLLLALAPRFHDVQHPSAKPKWRDFTPAEPEEITLPAIAASANAIGKRLLEHAGEDNKRWLALLDLWPSFDASWRAIAVDQLTRVAKKLADPEQVEIMRDELRSLLAKHRAFHDAQWAMGEDALKPLDEVFEILQPTGIRERVRWLFRPGAAELKPDIDWSEQQAELERAQCDAAEQLLAVLSEDELFSFARTITMQRAFGVAIASSSLSDNQKQAMMKRGLEASDSTDVEVGLGIMYMLKFRAQPEGDSWIRAIWKQAVAQNWDEAAELRIVQALPANKIIWEEIEARGKDFSDKYWHTLPIHLIAKETDASYVVDRMLQLDRAIDAVSWIANSVQMKPDGQLIVTVLRAAAKATQPLEDNAATMFSYYVGILLDYLEVNSSVDERDIVELEWIYFQLLRYSQRSTRILQRALARDPEFFVSLVKLIYLPDEGSGVIEPELGDAEKMRDLAGQAYNVIHDLSHVPGADDHGTIDRNALELWVKQSRKLLSEAGRSAIGDSKIGEILSAAKQQSDSPWPPEQVRDVIELVRSRSLEEGFECGVYNRRGVTVRMPHDGGALERTLVARYRKDAEALRFDWPRTAACLERIAETYEFDAKRADVSVEQREWL